MRSINHIMTVELQFKTPVTQKEARDYLSRVLAKANESLKNANDNVINEENLEAKKKQIANAFGAPQTVLEDIDGTWPPAADVKKPKKTEGVLKVPVTEEEIADMKQKRQKQAEKPKKIDWDKACALKKAGWSNKQIAEELHANEGTIGAMIYKHLEKYNAGERKTKYEEKAEV